MNEMIIKTEGMSCSNCEARVVARLSSLSGVESVVAKAADGSVTVKGSALDKAALSQAIEDLGFDVIG